MQAQPYQGSLSRPLLNGYTSLDNNRSVAVKMINLFGGPAARKSTLAAAVYVAMKEQGRVVELVREYATYLILSGRAHQLQQDQLSVLAKQNHLQEILEGKADWAVSDSPLPLNALYAQYMPNSFNDVVFDFFDRYANVNFFLEVDWDSYSEVNRVHNRTQAQAKHKQLEHMLLDRGVPFVHVPLGPTADRVQFILDHLP